MQRLFLADQVATGRIKMRPPTPPPVWQPLAKRFGVPAHLEAIRADPDAMTQLALSRSQWSSCNPGYIVRDGGALTSTMKTDFVWDEDEIEFMKAARLLDKMHNRRRDGFTHYVESKAMYDSRKG